VPVQLQQVVGGGDQAPFRVGGGPASEFEARPIRRFALIWPKTGSTIPSLRE
jgi:hypothetical protein